MRRNELLLAVGVGLVLAGACGPDDPSDPSPVVNDDGLVAAFDMSVDREGQLVDTGPHGLFGITLRDVRTAGADGTPGGARLFRTVQDRVDLPESQAFNLDGPLTLAARVRVDSLGLHQHIAACDDKWALWVTPDNRFRLGDTRGGGWSTEAGRVQQGAWTAVVAVLTGTIGDPLVPETVALWVDGERAGQAHLRSDDAQASGAWSAGDLYPDDACSLGFESHQGNAAHQQMPFVGALDEFLVYGRAWTPAEVQAFSR